MTPEQLLRRYFQVEMTRDVEQILALYAPAATFQTPDLLRTGHAEIRPFYSDAAERFPRLRVEITNAFGEGDWAAAEWSAVVVGTDGRALPLSGVNLAHFEDELIVEARSYYYTSSYLSS